VKNFFPRTENEITEINAVVVAGRIMPIISFGIPNFGSVRIDATIVIEIFLSAKEAISLRFKPYSLVPMTSAPAMKQRINNTAVFFCLRKSQSATGRKMMSTGGAKSAKLAAPSQIEEEIISNA
jgi:hypothetical protein